MNKEWLILGLNPHGTTCVYESYDTKKIAMQAYRELINLNQYPTMIFWVSSRQDFLKRTRG